MNRASPALRAFKATGVAFLLVAVAAAGLAAWLRGRVRASLPQLEGGASVPGLAGPVTVTRDSLGVPTLSGSSRLDVARATGWIHAQDRFFQMDTMRRRGAGELAELFGRAALPLDREARLHGFRELARRAVAAESPAHRAIIAAYTDGVNRGLSALRAPPWEYAALRTSPRPWSAEDTFLITLAMTLDLQEGTGRYVRNLAAIRDNLGRASLAFFAPLSTPDDAPMDGSISGLAPIPPASEIDLRRRADEGPGATASAAAGRPWEEAMSPGSNCFAVAGNPASGTAAILANDTHLRLALPNVWYRMRLKWPGHDETGVSIPGAPVIVAGSTGRIAWGFTNSNAGVGDVVVINPSVSPDLYHGPDNEALVPYEHRTQTVAVRGSKPETMDFLWTVWGPVVGETPDGRVLVFHWTEDDPAATNMAIAGLEDAGDVSQAVAVAHDMGLPAQNFVVADASGRVAWTIAGRLPRRVGYDGRLPVSWAFGDRRWEGFLAGGQVPTIASPAGGLVWTANNRTVGGAALEAIGDSGYAIAARARMIRDDLLALRSAGRPLVPADLMAVQLDDRAILLGWWRDLLVASLPPKALEGHPGRAAVLEAVRSWEGRADTGSVSYRAVRTFRLAVARRVLDPVFKPCVDSDPAFTWGRLNYEAPLEALLKERPAHLLDPQFRSWEDLLAAAVDDVSSSYSREHADPRTATWGEHNIARIEHPFAQLLPRWLGGWLSMPADPLAGDDHMPRVQDPSFGASERFVVSPGREPEGLFNMPGGQCANPLSPYFGAGHEAWVRGTPVPFLPGAAEHTLVLSP